jgi:hypothetical protein
MLSTSATSSGSRELVIRPAAAAWAAWPGAHDRHPLLLAPRQAVGVLLALLVQPDPVQQRVGPLLGLLAAQPQDLAASQGDVLEHVHVREQVEALEDDADLAPVAGRRRRPIRSRDRAL